MTMLNIIKAAYDDGFTICNSKDGGFRFEIHLKSGKSVSFAPEDTFENCKERGFISDAIEGLFIPFDSIEYIRVESV